MEVLVAEDAYVDCRTVGLCFSHYAAARTYGLCRDSAQDRCADYKYGGEIMSGHCFKVTHHSRSDKLVKSISQPISDNRLAD